MMGKVIKLVSTIWHCIHWCPWDIHQGTSKKSLLIFSRDLVNNWYNTKLIVVRSWSTQYTKVIRLKRNKLDIQVKKNFTGVWNVITGICRFHQVT